MSFVPSRVLQRIFPPMVTGKTNRLVSRIYPYWVRNCNPLDWCILNWLVWDSQLGRRFKRLSIIPYQWHLRTLSHNICPAATSVCVHLTTRSWIYSTCTCRWGSPEFIGIGFLSFVSIILTERFGSPFLKNISIIVGLVIGCIVAGAAGYIDNSSIKTAPAITFLWYVQLNT
jgi:hypothetical protein